MERPERACAWLPPGSGGSRKVVLPSIRMRGFAPLASSTFRSEYQRNTTFDMHRDTDSQKCQKSTSRPVPWLEASHGYSPREFSGRHRTTTLMFPSPCSAIVNAVQNDAHHFVEIKGYGVSQQRQDGQEEVWGQKRDKNAFKRGWQLTTTITRVVSHEKGMSFTRFQSVRLLSRWSYKQTPRNQTKTPLKHL